MWQNLFAFVSMCIHLLGFFGVSIYEFAYTLPTIKWCFVLVSCHVDYDYNHHPKWGPTPNHNFLQYLLHLLWPWPWPSSVPNKPTSKQNGPLENHDLEHQCNWWLSGFCRLAAAWKKKILTKWEWWRSIWFWFLMQKGGECFNGTI